MTLFLTTLAAHCAAQPGKLAIEVLGDDGQRVTYGELETQVRRAMAYLQAQGVTTGDRVGMVMPKGLPFIYLHIATMRLGAISLPLNPAYPASELRYFLHDAEIRLLFTYSDKRGDASAAVADLAACQQVVCIDNDADFAALTGGFSADESPAPLPDDPGLTALMIYTSGTTGRPKGAQLSHGNLTANLNSLHTAWGWREDDVLLHILPIFHVHGLIVALHGALNAGATALLMRVFQAEDCLRTLEARQCTVLMAVPTIHRRLVSASNATTVNLSHMRLITSGSDRLPDDLFARFERVFGHRLLERYGMSETSMLTSNPLRGERRIGSVGLPLPGVAVRIVNPEDDSPLPDGEVGEVQVRGDNVTRGYWRQPEKTAEAFTADGWFRTGDLGLREPDGYYTLKGRAKDLIISGGYNIYPPEVERVLAAHPGVTASAVIGCPNDEWGETVTAVVVKRPGARVTEDEIIDYCREQLVRYKAPRRVLFAPSLPRNALGKVQKAQLRKSLCGD